MWRKEVHFPPANTSSLKQLVKTGNPMALTPGKGGVTGQVEQVSNLRSDSGVSRAKGNDSSTGSSGRAQQTLSPRILLWETGFVSLTLPRTKVMEEEGLRNFQELRAKFQHLDTPSLSRPIKIPAGISPKGDTGNTQTANTLANGKPPLSNHWRLSYCPSTESQSLTPQKTKVTHRNEIQKYSSSSEPPGKSPDPAGNSQNSLLLNVNLSDSKTVDKEKIIVANNFKDKLWNWEKVSSQKSEVSSVFPLANRGRKAFHVEEQTNMKVIAKEPRKGLETKESQTLPSQRNLTTPPKSLTPPEDSASLLSHHGPEKSPARRTYQPIYERELLIEVPEKQPVVRRHQLPKTKPLPSVESLGPPPAKPPKPPVVNLCAFQRKWAALPKTPGEAAAKEGYVPPESAEFEEAHKYEATISYLRQSGNSINLCTTKEIADSTYEVEIEEPQKPCKSFLHHELSLKHEDKDKRVKEKEPHELKSQKMEKDSSSSQSSKVHACGERSGKEQMASTHGGRSILNGKQDVATKATHTRVCPQDPKMTQHSQRHRGYIETLKVTRGQRDFKPNPISEETYDDVEYPGRERSKSDFSDSFTSDNEENSGEMYEDVYKTKGNFPKIDLDGKEAVKKLQKFFKKEKDKFKMKKSKPKENTSGFSISMPDLDLKSQEAVIYDDVDTNEKETKDEDKLKTWKPKFLTPEEKKEKNSEETERNFFKIKKQNFKKNRMEREEKHFREKFEYDKEIIVINTAVACSSNSRNGMFDLPITPGEELEVIDITEENQVICRNSKGRYGYVLIEHLNFKHQGWSP